MHHQGTTLLNANMTEPPVKTTSTETAKIMMTQLIELFDSESKDESKDINIPEDLCDFFTLGTRGPKLDEKTVKLLGDNGVRGHDLSYSTRNNLFERCFCPSGQLTFMKSTKTVALKDVN